MSKKCRTLSINGEIGFFSLKIELICWFFGMLYAA